MSAAQLQEEVQQCLLTLGLTGVRDMLSVIQTLQAPCNTLASQLELLYARERMRELTSREHYEAQ